MTAFPSTYAVGRGKPPLHTRFKKGQSGNPSGKPGPAKLAKQRFERALFAALEGSEAELELSKPENVIAGIARRMALDASAGRMQAVRLVLSLLDAENAKTSTEDDSAELAAEEAELLSLLQGKTQGNGKEWLEDILWPDDKKEPAPVASARTRNEAQPLSLLQGKSRETEKIRRSKFALRFDRTERRLSCRQGSGRG
jgi:hypothetical protein